MGAGRERLQTYPVDPGRLSRIETTARALSRSEGALSPRHPGIGPGLRGEIPRLSGYCSFRGQEIHRLVECWENPNPARTPLVPGLRQHDMLFASDVGRVLES